MKTFHCAPTYRSIPAAYAEAMTRRREKDKERKAKPGTKPLEPKPVPPAATPPPLATPELEPVTMAAMPPPTNPAPPLPAEAAPEPMAVPQDTTAAVAGSGSAVEDEVPADNAEPAVPADMESFGANSERAETGAAPGPKKREKKAKSLIPNTGPRGKGPAFASG
jgi:hypothetical protein